MSEKCDQHPNAGYACPECWEESKAVFLAQITSLEQELADSQKDFAEAMRLVESKNKEMVAYNALLKKDEEL